MTDHGLVAIAEVEPGDRVYGLDVESSETRLAVVRGRISVEAREIVRLDLGSEVICCTPNHRFYRDGWVSAKALEPGDRLRTLDGRESTVRARTRQPGGVPVFNLALAGGSTFVVGEAGAVVHADKPEDGVEDGDGISPAAAAVPELVSA